jgi:diaminohydroxyphosphoribosylaminopyrimidine deaminase / 5-amino-6-(5-phosphoribosylamino)uracil reductase
LSSERQLVRTAGEAPVLVAVGRKSPEADRTRLATAGCEVVVCDGATHAERLDALLAELGRRRLTNVLVEGGGRLLGSLLDARAIDEAHVFIAPKLFGGAAASGPIAGEGVGAVSGALALDSPEVEQVGTDVYVHGRVARS